MKKTTFYLSMANDVSSFMNDLEPKHFRQVAKKIFSLLNDPYPNDSSDLVGYDPLKRVDIGEYRIIYQVMQNVVEVWFVGKRNDDEVYKKLKRIF